MLAIFWTAYIPFVMVILYLAGCFMVRMLGRFSAQLRSAPSRKRLPRASIEQPQWDADVRQARGNRISRPGKASTSSML
jgi:hypothetical protein